MNIVSRPSLEAIEEESKYIRLYAGTVDMPVGSDETNHSLVTEYGLPSLEDGETRRLEFSIDFKAARFMYTMDVCLLVGGVLMCIGSTFITVADIGKKLESGHC